MNDDCNVLLKLCGEEWSLIRHYEEQRATVTNFVIVIASIAVGFIIQQKMSTDALPIAILLIVLGVYGAIAVTKLFERTQLAATLVGRYTDRLDELCPNSGIKLLRSNALAKHKSKFPIMSTLHMNHLWLALHIIIAVSGLVLAVVIIF